ncbi:MAG: small conductance mechanosensitive channel [Thermoleophilaceae bacterium]|nr:small conductance mechanosensitive channel [Thermoleophilaceae bacterium]
MRATAAHRLRKQARRAQREAVAVAPLIAAVVLAYRYREQLFGVDVPVRIGSAIALVALGWRFARDVGRALGPLLFSRLEPSTAGVVGFLIRLFLLLSALLVAFRVIGVDLGQLAFGGAFTAVVVGLAAQGTLGNLFAGVLLLTVQPFTIGERVRFQAGGLAGQLEGVISSLGLLYVVLAQGDDTVMVPNSTVLAAAIVPLREPAGVDLRARFDRGVKPSELQNYFAGAIQTPTRSDISIGVESVGQDEVVMRIRATPEHDREGARLADEILAAIERLAEPSVLDRRGDDGGAAAVQHVQPDRDAEPADGHQHDTGGAQVESVYVRGHGELENGPDGDQDKARTDGHR